MSVYQRNDNKAGAKRWHYRKWITLPDGRKVRITGTPSINTKRGAEEAERAHIERSIRPVDTGLGQTADWYGPNEIDLNDARSYRILRRETRLSTSLHAEVEWELLLLAHGNVIKRTTHVLLRRAEIDGQAWVDARWSFQREQHVTSKGRRRGQTSPAIARQARAAGQLGGRPRNPSAQALPASLLSVCDEDNIAKQIDDYCRDLQQQYPALRISRKNAARSLILKALQQRKAA